MGGRSFHPRGHFMPWFPSSTIVSTAASLAWPRGLTPSFGWSRWSPQAALLPSAFPNPPGAWAPSDPCPISHALSCSWQSKKEPSNRLTMLQNLGRSWKCLCDFGLPHLHFLNPNTVWRKGHTWEVPDSVSGPCYVFNKQ